MGDRDLIERGRQAALPAGSYRPRIGVEGDDIGRNGLGASILTSGHNIASKSAVGLYGRDRVGECRFGPFRTEHFDEQSDAVFGRIHVVDDSIHVSGRSRRRNLGKSDRLCCGRGRPCKQQRQNDPFEEQNVSNLHNAFFLFRC